MILRFSNKEITINKLLIVIIVVLFIAIILIAIFPKNEKIVCTKKETLNSEHLTEIYTGIFKKNKLKTLIVDFEKKLTADYEDTIDYLYTDYSKQLEQLKNKGGYKYTIKKNNDSVSFKSTIDVNKIPDETKYKVGFNGDWEYDAFRENLEKNGFNCK